MRSEQYRTERFVHQGHELVYDAYGEGERLLVYMHGLLLDAELNRGIAGALAEQGNRVVLLDLLGHGRSDKPTHASEYRIDSYATQVFALLDELGAEQGGARWTVARSQRQPVRGVAAPRTGTCAGVGDAGAWSGPFPRRRWRSCRSCSPRITHGRCCGSPRTSSAEFPRPASVR